VAFPTLLPKAIGRSAPRHRLPLCRCGAATDEIPQRSLIGDGTLGERVQLFGFEQTLNGDGWLATHEAIIELQSSEEKAAHVAQDDALTAFQPRAAPPKGVPDRGTPLQRSGSSSTMPFRGRRTA
jgi:hypothetical protein